MKSTPHPSPFVWHLFLLSFLSFYIILTDKKKKQETADRILDIVLTAPQPPQIAVSPVKFLDLSLHRWPNERD